MSRRSSVVAAGLLLVLASAFLPTVLKKMPDFEVYWRAGRRVLAAEPLYRAEDGHYQLKYLPAFALLVAPVAILPLKAAKAVWFFLTLAAIGGLIAASIRLLPRRLLPTRTLALLAALAMLKFFAHELNLGQSNAMMAWLIVTAFSLIGNKREVLAGLAIAAAVIVKPYAIAFLPYLAIKRQRLAFCASLGGVAVGLLTPAAIYGWRGSWGLLRTWVDTLSESTLPNLVGQDNVSIWAMYAKWFWIGPSAFWLASLTIALAASVFLLFVWR